jgi:hypothetical protein
VSAEDDVVLVRVHELGDWHALGLRSAAEAVGGYVDHQDPPPIRSAIVGHTTA